MNRKMKMPRIAFLLSFVLFFWLQVSLYAAGVNQSAADLKVAHFAGASVEIVWDRQSHTLHAGERVGDWTLMEIINEPGKPPYAILEDWAHANGHLIFVDMQGVRIDLPKSSDPTSADPKTLLGGHTPDEINASPSDLLGDQILAKPGDPDYEEVARVFPPIRKIKTYSFVGTPDTIDKIGFVYGGRTPDFDPAPDYQHLNHGWMKRLAPAMKINLPDERVANMARFSLVRDMMTRAKDYPHYGAFDKDYFGSEHEGFPDTFTVDTAASLDWGLIDLAGRYIDNYFDKYVRDDGSILYRGPETGQYGRMLTVVAQYVNFGGDPKILLQRRSRIDGVTKLLLMLRAKAKTLPASDPAHGMIAGWSEADACLDADPPRYMQPYFSNSTEAARGFRDLGKVWQKIGKQTQNAELTAWGQRLVRKSEELQKDIRTAISRSIIQSEEVGR